MKTLAKSILTLMIGMVLAGQAQAQAGIADNPKYGPNSLSRVECAKNLSLTDQYTKQKNYKDSIGPWRWTYENCPQESKNIYLDGVKIMKGFVKTNKKDEALKEAYIDTLMMVYDKRIEYYKQEGNVRGRQGIDLLRYRKHELEKINGYLTKSIELQKNKSADAVIVSHMQVNAHLFKQQKLEAAKVIDIFISSSETLDYRALNGKSSKSKDRSVKAKISLEKIFTESGAATKEALTAVYQPQFEATPNDVELLKKIIQFLGKADGGSETEFYINVTETLIALEPSAKAFSDAAEMFLKRQEFKKAIGYYDKAIELEADTTRKANYYYTVGYYYNIKMNNPQKARSYAKKAIELKPDWGKPYILIGLAYAGSSKTCKNGDNVDGPAVFWVAVDMFVKAKKVDPSVEAEADGHIATYSKYYPNNEEAFFFGIKKGDKYKVGCWINATTTARF